MSAKGNPSNPDIKTIPAIDPIPKIARYKKPIKDELICVNTNSVNAPDPASPCIVPISRGFIPTRESVCEWREVEEGSCSFSWS